MRSASFKTFGSTLATLAAFGAFVLASPAGAEEQGSRAVDPYPSAAAGWQRDLDRLGAEAFERGYRAGRTEERRHATSDAARSRMPEFTTGLAWNDEVQGEAFERLERAAVELQRSLALMQRQPSLPRVNGAIAQARQALVRTQNAMTWLPPLPGREDEPAYERLRGRTIGPERASGGWEG
jgi:hypothetical protein